MHGREHRVRLLRPRVVAAVSAAILTVALGAVAAPASGTDPAPEAPCGGLVPMESNAPANAPVAAGAYFSFPNTTSAEKMAIRDRVLAMIRSTNGKYCADTGQTDADDHPVYEVRHGVVKIATWSFNDWTVANALKAAKSRGASVQAVAARSINQTKHYKPWIAAAGVRRALGYHRAPVPSGLTYNDEVSWAHDCGGSCRGPRGTQHAKFFLFQDVGTAHLRDAVMQSSMNLTKFAYTGQWNQADVRYDAAGYDHFAQVFYELAREFRGGFLRWDGAEVSDIFFPKYKGADPAMRVLSNVSCAGSKDVRVINYAFYDTRGLALARQLRDLWGRGCEVKVIYSISSRGVMRILRAHSGRGPIPVRQSVIRKRGKVVKYNHSKWVSVGDRVLDGSGNWSNNSFQDDEQFQEFSGAGPFAANFTKTWNQRTSKVPRIGRVGPNFRNLPEEPQWGRGELKHLTPYG